MITATTELRSVVVAVTTSGRTCLRRRRFHDVPEGHVTHRIARDHGKLFNNTVVRVSSPQGRFAADAALVNGTTLRKIEAYGKHLFYRWNDDHIVHVHLGLFGKYRLHRGPDSPEPKGAVRMRIANEAATSDLAGPTDCRLITGDEHASMLARLGPDPLRNDARPDDTIARLRKSSKAVGALLLDQQVLAGVGNVYRAEALFVCGIHPDRPGRELSAEEAESLWTTCAGMLKQGLKDGRIVTVDRSLLDLPKGARVKRGDTTWVYHRDTCLRCATPIRTSELGGRPCYYCPTCQSA
jgi:endonuclease VIII